LPISSNKRDIQKTNRFGRDIRRLPTNVQENAFQAATKLSVNIFDQSLNIKRLTGFPGIYRVVVVHDYRMIFSFDDENVYLLRIAHRREIYKSLEL
jgi:mRNA-degrading endonuclease RelE of RelBE toxin-antitoxin system